MSYKAERNTRWSAIVVTLALGAAPAFAAPRAGVLAEELADGSRLTATALTRALQRDLTLLGFSSTPQHTLGLFARGFRAGPLLGKAVPQKLSDVALDIAVAARLTLRSRRDAAGNHDARLDLRVLEVATRRPLAAFSGQTTVAAPTLGTARDRARATLLKQAWARLRPALASIGGGRGEVLLYLAREGLPLAPQRLAARLAELPEVTDARLISVHERHALFGLRAASGNARLPAILAHRLGVVAESGRQLAWWGRCRGVPGRIAVRLAPASTAPGLAGALARLAPELVARAFDNSLRLYRSNDRSARVLRVSLGAGSLEAQIEGTPISPRGAGGATASITARAALPSPRGLAAASWQLAIALDAAAARADARLAALPALGALRYRAQLASFDLLGVLAGTGQLEGLKQRPTVIFGGLAGNLRVTIPDFGTGEQAIAVARKVALAVPLDRAKLAALSRPDVAVLRLELSFGKGTQQRRDQLDLPLPLWSRQLVDVQRAGSLAGLVDVHDETVRGRLGRALHVARELRPLLRLEQGLWLPLCAYGVLQAARVKTTTLVSSKARLRWHQLPGETLRLARGSRADQTIAVASLLAAAGARTRFWRQRDGGFLLAVDTGWLPGAAGLAQLEARRLVTLDGTLWAPLAVEVGRSFEQAWTAGAREFAALGAQKRHGVEVRTPLLRLAPAVAGALDEASFRENAGGAARSIVRRQEKRTAAIIKAAQLDKGAITKRLGVAKELLRIRAVAKARQLLEGYLVLKERDPRAELLLAATYAYQGAFQLAREHFDKAKGGHATLGSGIASALLGDTKRALAALRGHGAVAAQLGLRGKRPAYLAGPDRPADALARIAGADNLSLREKLLGQRSGPDRRLLRRALDLLRY